VVERLQQEFAGQSVVFVEQNVDAPIGSRQTRWWAGYTGSVNSVYLPLIMADSGHQISNGSQADFYATYKAMIMAEIARAPEAEISAFVRRVDDTLRTYVWLKNNTKESLSGSTNGATISAIVYENLLVGLTSHTTRAVPSVSIAPSLAVGHAATFTVTTDRLSGVGWDALNTVVVVDYRPRGGKAYDLLQAAVAQPAGLLVTPANLAFSVDRGESGLPAAALNLNGPFVLAWAATSDADWLTVEPAAGTLPASPQVIVDPRRLPEGPNVAHITLHAEGDGMSFTTTVEVQAYYGSVRPRRRLVAPAP
jgi:hypothetical protein